ncbi:MAG: tetratricopeptide repeat protein [Thiohalocapsa sp.]
MFPKLTPLQWLIAIAFLAFYGFSVFAVTRDYYLRHPPRPAQASATGLPATDAALGAQMRAAAQDAGPDIPAELLASDPNLLSQEADRLFAAQRFAEAVPLYRKALELDPSDAGTNNDLGLALHYMGNSIEGVDVLRAGAAEAPEFQRIWLSLGFVAAQAGQTEQAREALTKAQAIDPRSDVGIEAANMLRALNAAP